MSFSRPLTPTTITTESTRRSCHVPDVRLKRDLELPFRVYVLKCRGKHADDEYYWYVGIIEAKALVARMKKHFSRDGASSFTKAHRPLSIEFVWPAATSAAEALVSHRL